MERLGQILTVSYSSSLMANYCILPIDVEKTGSFRHRPAFGGIGAIDGSGVFMVSGGGLP
jgi:hypothetical protein